MVVFFKVQSVHYTCSLCFSFLGRILFLILKGLALVKRIGFLILNFLAFIIYIMTEFEYTASKKKVLCAFFFK
jgi:hypothetical protein